MSRKLPDGFPAKLVSEVTDTKYSIEIGVAATLRLFMLDQQKRSADDVLSSRIDKIMGVYDCNYDGHFGPYVYFTVEKDYDTPETHAAIHKLIREHVK